MIRLPSPAVELAERQLGVLARFQLVRVASDDQVDGLVRRRVLVPIERGVYRLAGGARPPQQGAFAAQLRARPPATITGPAVLGHLGVDGFRPDAPFELLVPAGRSLRNVGFPWRVDPRPDREVLRCGQVRLAAPADALVHSVQWRAQLGDRALRLACDWLGWRGVLDRGGFLGQLTSRAEVDPLAAGLLEVLGGLALGRSESEGERHVGRLVLGFDPAPQPQVWVTPSRRADWYFRRLRLVVEYDGDVDHAGRTRQEADTVRDAELESAGIVVVRVRRDDLDDEPALQARLVTAVILRAAELGVPAPRFTPATAEV